MSLVLAVDKSPVTKALIDVCDKLDVDCAGKNPDYPKGLSPGKDGSVKLQVPQGFAGFVRISDAAFVDTRVYVGRPLMAQPDFNQVRLLRPGDYSGLAALAGLDVDVKRGTAIFASIDCRGQTASAVRFKSPSADSKSTGFYLINQVPAMPPAASSTDKDGFGGFFNLPPGNAVGRAYRAKDETFIGESSFQVLANTISFVLIGPSPE